MPLSTGSRVGPYEILATIGAGGMGEVYRARDAKLGRDIAIKVLPAETSADPDRRRRFEQEARSASGLNHPNILTIHDIESADDGSLYIAMELVEGRTVRELLASGEPLPTKKLLDIGVQTAEGLAKAHGAGIVHRDLKPENLIVSKDGYVKILDFGLAKLTEPVSKDASVLPTVIGSPTEPGTVMGTAGYMSPEQASGQPVDFRSDQFALGAILYEMATGKRAFQRKTGAETLVAIIREEPEPLAQAAPRAPAPVRWIVERCLAKDPEERYASTKDLARDLVTVRGHLTETSGSGALSAAEPIRIRRRSILPAALAFLVGAGLALLAAKTLGLFQQPPPRFQRLTFRRGAIVTARFAPDGVTVVYGASWDGNPTELFTARPESPESKSLGLPPANLLSVSRQGELAISLGWHPLIGWESTGLLARVPSTGGAPREVLEDVGGADWFPERNDLAVVHRVGDRMRLEYPIGTVIAEATGWMSDPRVSPDGKFIAVMDHPERGDNAGRLVLFDVAGHRRIEGPSIAGTSSFAWSPRGVILIGEGGIIRRVSTSGLEHPAIALAGGFLPEDVAPDGRLLAKRANYRREIVGVAEGQPRERNLTWLDWSFPDDISVDGKMLLFDEQSRGRQNYFCYLRKTDGSPAVLLGQSKGLSLSPDGRWALTEPVSADQLFLVPTGAGSPRALPKSGLRYDWGTFFPDGKRILLWAHESGHRGRLYVQSIDGGAPRPITPEGFGLSFGGKPVSPDGRWVAAVAPDRTLAAVPVDGGPPRPVPDTAREEAVWGWTTDSRSLYIGKIGMPARVEICDVATGARRFWKEIVPPDPAGVLAIGPIVITPDGKSYVYSYRRTLDDLFLVTGLK